MAKKRAASVAKAAPASPRRTIPKGAATCAADRVAVKRTKNQVRIAFFKSAHPSNVDSAHPNSAAHNGGSVCVANLVVPGDVLEEMIEALQAGLDDRPTADAEAGQEMVDDLARLRLKRITPSNAQLRKLARKRHPPAAYFEGDMERPW